jgi:methionyl aminopeptidase
MINIRSEDELKKIRVSCMIAAKAMEVARDQIKPGKTTKEISDKVFDFIESQGAKAAFFGYNGYPEAICLSVNDEVVHGIPGKRVLVEGDLLKVDIGTYIHGFYGDVARTFAVGSIKENAERLKTETEISFHRGVENAISGNQIGDIGYAVQKYTESKGYSVVRDLVGHGIGRRLHEEPQVPNFGRQKSGPLLKSGMVIAIEPMINEGTWRVRTLNDNWTVVTTDGKLSAHYENTCVVRDGFSEILTLMDGEKIA